MSASANEIRERARRGDREAILQKKLIDLSSAISRAKRMQSPNLDRYVAERATLLEALALYRRLGVFDPPAPAKKKGPAVGSTYGERGVVQKRKRVAAIDAFRFTWWGAPA